MELTTFAICRRVHRRRFALRPDAALTGLVTWLLAVVANGLGIEIHAATVMSTHMHLVISARDQHASLMMERLNGVLAKAVNVLRKYERGILWPPGELGMVELKTTEAVVFQIAYAIVNPVAAGLVWSPEDWPGLNLRVHEPGGGQVRAKRPAFYFRAVAWAETAVLNAVLPPCLRELGDEDAREMIRVEVARQLRAARADIRAKRHRVLGPVAASNVSPYRRAKTWEEYGTLNPRFAAGPGRRDALEEAMEEYVEFQLAYRAAWRRYRAGEEDVVFPYGTYRMRVRFGVRVADPPT